MRLACESRRCEIEPGARDGRLYVLFDGTLDAEIDVKYSPLLALKVADGKISVVDNDLLRCVLRLEDDH